MNGQPLRYLSLFSGIGGFDLGFDRAGMVCAGQVEIDDYCRRVLAKHWPDVKRMADIKEVEGDDFGAVDVICGGFPCQPHSKAGQRRGETDDRNLWPEMRRVIDAIRPAWVVAENVPGIRTTIIDNVLSDLEGMDYAAGTIIVPACAVEAPHIRERLFILAHDGRGRREPRSGLLSAVSQGIGGGRPAHGGITGGERMGTCEGCGEDWCNWHGRHREDCGCPDPWDESDDPDFGWFAVEPGVVRMVNGVPNGVDRRRALGNAVVPQVAEWIGRRIAEAQQQEKPQ